MVAVLVVIPNVIEEQAAQMSFVDHDDMIQLIAPDSAYPSFGNPILPRAAQ